MYEFDFIREIVEHEKSEIKNLLMTSQVRRKKQAEIIGNSTLVKTSPLYDSEKDISAKAYHVAHSKLILEEQEVTIQIVIKEDVNAKFIMIIQF